MINNNESIETSSVNISLKMLWTFAVSLLIGSFSLAGFYISFIGNMNALRSEFNENKTFQTGRDQIQNLQLENIKLNAQKQEIDLKELGKKLDQKKDK